MSPAKASIPPHILHSMSSTLLIDASRLSVRFSVWLQPPASSDSLCGFSPESAEGPNDIDLLLDISGANTLLGLIIFGTSI